MNMSFMPCRSFSRDNNIYTYTSYSYTTIPTNTHSPSPCPNHLIKLEEEKKAPCNSFFKNTYSTVETKKGLLGTPHTQRASFYYLPDPTLLIMHLIRNPIILAIPKREVHVLQTLGRRTLEEIVNRRIDHNTLAGGVYGKATNLDTVLSRNVFHERGLADDFDKFFAGVAVLVDVADVTGCHCAVEGNGDCVLWESLVRFK
jgi:hypothetical protein